MPTTAPVIDLRTLAAAQGFVIQGDATEDVAGWSVSSAGDVNSDGIADLIVGAPWNDDGGYFAGAAYVLYGRAGADRGRLDLSGLSADTGFVIQGDEGGSIAVFGDRAGLSVSSAGDVNGDGIDDLIVGAPTGDDAGLDAGEAYVIYGRVGARPGRVDLTGLTADQGFVIQGEGGGPFMLAGGRAGGSVSDAGDVNGDGIDDLIVGADLNNDGGAEAGQAYVIYGQLGASRGNVDLGALTAAQGFAIQGDATGDRAGFSVSSAGDVNGDGLDDLIVGAPYGDDGGDMAGEAYVIYGEAGATRGALDLSTLSTPQGFIIQGDLAGDRAGLSVSSAGDVNGDGFNDLIVGAPNETSGGRGEAYLVYGKAGASRSTLDLSTLNAAQGFMIQGDDGRYDGIGFSVSSAGDVNGDGLDDLILGVFFDSSGADRSTAGGAYVVYGKAGASRGTIDLQTLTADEGFFIRGDQGGTAVDVFGDRAGFSVSSAGDANGDGIDDLIVGAPFGDDGGTDAGEAYVIYGSRPTEAVERIGTAIGQAIFGGAFDDTLRGLGGNDRIDGGAGADSLVGGAGIDTLDYSRAASAVAVNLRTGIGTLGEAAGDTVLGFERIIGSAHDDRLAGNNLGNFLDGGAGNDTMLGGAGNDSYVVNTLGDRVFETTTATSGTDAGGIDTVNSAVTFSLDASAGARFVERLMLTGTGHINGSGNALANTLTGNAGNNRLNGGASTDTMLGGAGNDTYVVDAVGDRVFETTTTFGAIDAGGIDTVQSRVNLSLDASAGLRFVERLTLTGAGNINGTGNALTNTLTGNAGNNILNGRLGNDTLLGGGGSDVFIFNTATGAGNIDRIGDYDVLDDTIRLDDSVFVGLATGALAVSAFAANLTGSATDGLDRIIYETDTGRLYFDADGSGNGARVHFATLTANLSLTNADFGVF